MKTILSTGIPTIGISAALLTIETGSYLGLERAGVLNRYIEAIVQSGGLPVILPVVEQLELAALQMDLVDGLLLSGGCDVAPAFYKEEPQPGLELVKVDRDFHEFHLLETARKLNKPILGICRGLQLINVAFGGTLYQDIPSALPNAIQHSQKSKPHEPMHAVTFVPGTKTHRIFEEELIYTNTFHHQAIKELAEGLVASGHTSDGLIEAIEGKQEPFLVAVQWHPELMFMKHPKMCKLFHSFVDAARTHALGSL